MSEIVTIRSRVTSKEYTVSGEDWAAMEEKNRGQKLFSVVNRTQSKSVRTAPLLPPVVPPEVAKVTKAAKAEPKKKGGSASDKNAGQHG